MIGVNYKKFGGFSDGHTCEAVVTLCQVGCNGWHVHSRYLTACGSTDCAGKCGTVETIEEARELFSESCDLAEKWAAQH